MDQQNMALSVQVRQSELLAQKLYNQCRDFKGAFKDLTGSLRKLGNILGEIDEALDGRKETTMDFKLLLRATQCRTVLEKLEVTLTSWKFNKNNDVDPSFTMSLRSDIEIATQDLVDVHETMSRQVGTASSTSSAVLGAKSSEISAVSMNSANNVSDHTIRSDIPDPRHTPHLYSDEKEVWEPPNGHIYHPSNFADPRNSQVSEKPPQPPSDPAGVDSLPLPRQKAPQSTVDFAVRVSPRMEAEGESIDSAVLITNNITRGSAAEQFNTPAEPVEPPLTPVGRASVAGPTVPEEDARAITVEKSEEDNLKHENTEASPEPVNLLHPEAAQAISSQLASGNSTGSESQPLERSNPPPIPHPSDQDTAVVDRSTSPALSEEDLYTATPPQRPRKMSSNGVPPSPTLQLSPKLTEMQHPQTLSTGGASSYSSAGWFAAHAEGLTHARTVRIASSRNVSPAPSFELDGNEISKAPVHPNPPKAPLIRVYKPPSETANRPAAKPTRYHARKPSEPNGESSTDAVLHRSRASSTGDITTDFEKSPALQAAVTFPTTTHRKSVDEAIQTQRLFSEQDFDDKYHAWGSIPDLPLSPLTAEKNPSQVNSTRGPPSLHPLRGNPPSQHSMRHASPPHPPGRPPPRRPRPGRPPPVPQRPKSSIAGTPWGPDSIGRGDETFYGPSANAETGEDNALDGEYAAHVAHFFNTRKWHQAEMHLCGWLDSLQARSAIDTIRRVQHILGVIASLQGQWTEAMHRFVRVLKKPVRDAADLDDGDCAAAYWLGDLYAMQNERADAFLAYCIAQRSRIASEDPHYLPTLSMDQETVHMGFSKPDYHSIWTSKAVMPPDSPPRVTDPNIISIPVAKFCLERATILVLKKPPEYDDTFVPDASRRRSNYLTANLTAPQAAHHERFNLRLDPNTAFHRDAPWPFPYDPLFCIANVARGRLLAHECDMLAVLTSNPSAKLQRPLRIKSDSFTTTLPLTWLIPTLRTILQDLEMGYSEVVNVRGTWFCCRHSFLVAGIATTNYFGIRLVRSQLLSSGLGVEVVGDAGVGSARVVMSSNQYERGVHVGEPKRLRKLIRECLQEAAKARRKELSTG